MLLDKDQPSAGLARRPTFCPANREQGFHAGGHWKRCKTASAAIPATIMPARRMVSPHLRPSRASTKSPRFYREGCWPEDVPLSNLRPLFACKTCSHSGRRSELYPWRTSSTRKVIRHHLDRRCRFASRTPMPPPFSGINSIPPSWSAPTIASRVSSRPPISPSAASNRLMVGTDRPERLARSSWAHPRSALAALI